MNPTISLIVGIVGLTMLLVAFVLANIWGKRVQEGRRVWLYHILNWVGGFALTWYAFSIRNWVFTILEGIWGGFAFASFVILITKIARNKGANNQK